MLGFFPRLYSDELLYSWLARYHLYSMNPGYKRTMIDLFGNSHQIAIPDLPVNLQRLHDNVKHFVKITPEDMMLNHTFFRFYTTFALPEIKKRVLSSMKGDAMGGAVHMEAGIMASTFKEKEFFQYCVLCAEEDLQTNGEMYWHLPHQLPGVLVCMKHQISLSKSLAPFRSDKRHNYVAASREVCPAIAPITSYNSKTMGHLLEIASQATRLLQQDFSFDRDVLRMTYLALLQKKGFVRGKRYVHQRELAEQFTAFYGNECLRLLQSEVPIEGESSWLKEITRKHRKAFHPIRHLLLIYFLGETLDSISSLIHTSFHPFGEAPYPCLNQAADHFQEFVVNDLRISRCTNTGKPVGTFTCACGFQYSRRGPDRSASDRFRIGRIKSFGAVWQSRLVELIHVEKLSYRAAARKLGVDAKTVIKFSMKLKPSENGGREKPAKSDNQLAVKQKEWTDFRTRNPGFGTSQLRKEKPALYSWLYRNCRDWLTENSPTTTGGRQAKPRVDWATRDLRIAKQIQKAVEEMRQKTPPVRITQHRISRRVQSRALIEQHLDKLPETKKALVQLSESRDEFHLRRINWAVEKIRNEGDEPVEWLVARVAAIRLPLSPVVKSEIQKILQDFAPTERSAL